MVVAALAAVGLLAATPALVGCATQRREAARGTCLDATPGPAGSASATGGSSATGVPSPPGAGQVPPSPDPTSSGGAASGGAGQRLPDLALDCLNGSGPVRLDRAGRPTVINLWASWCAPCRRELPALQRFSAATGGQVTVVGVDTRDTRTAGESLVHDLGLTYPMLADPQAALSRAVVRSTLPITIFVDGSGVIRHVHDTAPLDDGSVAGLANQYLGVVVPR